MQISALEVTKLLTMEKSEPAKRRKADLEFVQITPDSLPETPRPDAAEVARVVEMVKKVPDARDDIVMQLKERIERGEYEVTGEEIADMMMRRMKADGLR
ncbi:MAG TPA: flagellar biosynthesis anti-sigma factor FlgM [Armatimonadota bacterium]|nr:flagellar biosynthesis anti-sigma factor FlgM [Armatimonadota bacterium]